MEIFIARQFEAYGPYSIENINLYLDQGAVTIEDLAWAEGRDTWTSLGELLGSGDDFGLVEECIERPTDADTGDGTLEENLDSEAATLAEEVAETELVVATEPESGRFTNFLLNQFERRTPPLDVIYEEAKDYSLSDWKNRQRNLVTGCGAVAAAVPGMHVIGLIIDLNYLLRKMPVCSYGIGAISGYQSGHGNILDKTDFVVVLGKWAGVDGLDNATVAKVAADLVSKVGTKGATKVLGKTMCAHAGLMVAKKIGGKGFVRAATQPSVKAAVKPFLKPLGKAGAKLLALPGGAICLGAFISGGINFWFMSDIAAAAEEWYAAKINVFSLPDGVPALPDADRSGELNSEQSKAIRAEEDWRPSV